MKFLLFVFILFPVSVWAADIIEANITNEPDCMRFSDNKTKFDQCLKLVKTTKDREDARNQEPRPDCFQGFIGNFGESIGRDYKHEQEKADQLKDAAEKRLETLKNCRQELRETWIAFQNKKAEQNKERALLPTKLRQAELDYQREMNRINTECEEKGKQEFTKYVLNIEEQSKGTLGPDQLHGFTNRVNSRRRHFFVVCYQAEGNVNAMRVAESQLRLNIDKAKAEMAVVDQMVQSFEEQTALVQKDVLRDCEKQNELNAYNESLAKRLTSKGNTNNSIETALNFSSSLLGCMGGTGGILDTVNPTGSGSAQ